MRPDILELLRRDHASALRLLALVAEVPVARHERRSLLLRRLDAVMREHGDTEERGLHALLESVPEAAERLIEARLEHRRMREHFEALRAVSTSDVTWAERAALLKAEVLRHVENDETTSFVLARRHIPQEELVGLGQRYARA